MSDDHLRRFEALFREHYDDVLAYALARSGVDVAKEAVAETFLVAWRRRAQVPEPALPWLLGVTRRTLSTQRRSLRRRDSLTERVVLHHLDVAGADPSVTVTERAIVVAAFSELNPTDRETLELVSWDGLSAADAAVVVGCSRATFAVRLSRARRRLEEALLRHDQTNLQASTRRSPQETR